MLVVLCSKDRRTRRRCVLIRWRNPVLWLRVIWTAQSACGIRVKVSHPSSSPAYPRIDHPFPTSQLNPSSPSPYPPLHPSHLSEHILHPNSPSQPAHTRATSRYGTSGRQSRPCSASGDSRRRVRGNVCWVLIGMERFWSRVVRTGKLVCGAPGASRVVVCGIHMQIGSLTTGQCIKSLSLSFSYIPLYNICLKLEPESGMIVSQGQYLIITKMTDTPLFLLGLKHDTPNDQPLLRRNKVRHLQQSSHCGNQSLVRRDERIGTHPVPCSYASCRTSGWKPS